MTTVNMNLDLPVVDVTPADVWAEMLVEALETVDEHDHSSGKGVKITPAGLNINSDMSFNSHQIEGISAVVLESSASDASDAYSVYVKSDELFYKDNAGNAVQLTNNGSIAGASGTISGLVSPASASFNSTGNVFSLNYDSGKVANLAAANVKLYPYDGSTSYSNNVQLKAPTSLSATYTWTLPESQAAGDRIVSIDSAGQLAYLEVLGTTNQVNVSQNEAEVTLSLPQDIHTAASPTFSTLTIDSGGDASAPAIVIGDADTGIYSSGAGAVGITLNGSSMLGVNSSGINVDGTITASDGIESNWEDAASEATPTPVKCAYFDGTIAASTIKTISLDAGWRIVAIQGLTTSDGGSLYAPMRTTTAEESATNGNNIIIISSNVANQFRLNNRDSTNLNVYAVLVWYVPSSVIIE